MNNENTNDIIDENDKILKRKEYMKEYREKNKEKLKSYESKKYNEKHNERVKKYVKKNAKVLKIIKEAFKLNKLIIEDEVKFNELKELLN
jgi:hypothetical protein